MRVATGCAAQILCTLGMLMPRRSFEHPVVSAEMVLKKTTPLIATRLPGYFDCANRETLASLATLPALTTIQSNATLC